MSVTAWAASPAPVMQPPKSNLCGQACVASLAGVPLERAVAACGRRGRTQRADLDRGLQSLGRGRLRRWWSRSTLPRTGIVRGKFGQAGSGGHWLVVLDGELLDPYPGGVTAPWRVASVWELVP